MHFEWDPAKEAENLAKHNVDFSTVVEAWSDPARLVFRYPGMTRDEVRYQFVGFDGRGVLTVRFTLRAGRIRVIGAGYWRKQKGTYEKEQHRT